MALANALAPESTADGMKVIPDDRTEASGDLGGPSDRPLVLLQWKRKVLLLRAPEWMPLRVPSVPALPVPDAAAGTVPPRPAISETVPAWYRRCSSQWTQ